MDVATNQSFAGQSHENSTEKKMAPNSRPKTFSKYRRARVTTRPYPETKSGDDIKPNSCACDSDGERRNSSSDGERRNSSSDDADFERSSNDHSSTSTPAKYLSKTSAFRLRLGVYFNALDRERLARDVRKSEICKQFALAEYFV
ncbi:uncharacterized protein LOC106655881 [Trichogramma pretiosum]|uniref:uncharacterized protein LOC106655881 n=1 Tax=Trichogramma pretiosum TaxID=7493 RepID=UPI0006C97A1B|nr:uncharacterized protein LOC106655881 [Trichogramma pretiosum]